MLSIVCPYSSCTHCRIWPQYNWTPKVTKAWNVTVSTELVTGWEKAGSSGAEIPPLWQIHASCEWVANGRCFVPLRWLETSHEPWFLAKSSACFILAASFSGVCANIIIFGHQLEKSCFNLTQQIWMFLQMYCHCQFGLVTLIDNRHHYHIVMPMANAQRRTLAPQREEKQAAANSRPTIQLNSSPKSIQSPSLVGCWAIQIQCLQRWGPSSHTTPGETNLRHDSKTWNKNITHQNHIQGIQGLANVV